MIDAVNQLPRIYVLWMSCNVVPQNIPTIYLLKIYYKTFTTLAPKTQNHNRIIVCSTKRKYFCFRMRILQFAFKIKIFNMNSALDLNFVVEYRYHIFLSLQRVK